MHEYISNASPVRRVIVPRQIPEPCFVALVNTTFLNKDKIIGSFQQLGNHSFS